MRFICVILPLVLFAFGGCSQKQMLEKFASKEDTATAKHYIDLLREKNFDAIEKDFDPDMKTVGFHDTLVKMSEVLPSEEPKSAKLVGYHVYNFFNNSHHSKRVDITFEYEFPREWLLINLLIQSKDGNLMLSGFHINSIPDSLENMCKFTLSGKSALHYIILCLTVLLPLFTLYALVLCIRTKIPKRKWLWIIFIIMGFGQFFINWTTGQWGFHPFFFQLFSASAFAQLYCPWNLSISLPVGAIMFLIKRKKWLV